MKNQNLKLEVLKEIPELKDAKEVYITSYANGKGEFGVCFMPDMPEPWIQFQYRITSMGQTESKSRILWNQTKTLEKLEIEAKEDGIEIIKLI